MPSRTSWKSHASLLLSRLGSKRAAATAGGGSSLVVQAGFPTSLADLFVKNRSKILPKKPTKLLPKKPTKHRPANPNPTPNPNPDPIPIPIPPPVIPVRSPSRDNTNTRNLRGLGLGLGFVAMALGVLAVGKKWVVLGITIVSFLLLVLESFGFLEEEEKKKLEPVVRVVDLSGRGFVSPIREGSPVSEMSLRERSEISVESLDFDENSKKKKKKRRLFRNLFKKKCRWKKDEYRPNEIEQIDEDGDDTEFLSFEDSDGVTEADSEEAVAVGGSVDVNRRKIKFVFLVVVLFGLLGGKVAAVVLCMAWVLLSGCLGTLWRKLKME